MLGSNESNINSGEAMVEIHKYSVKKFMWQPHFRTFCELVEGEENKLTTFSTWNIMLGCNIIFQQHLCKLGQLRRSNGRNSQVLGQATNWPLQEVITLQGERHCTYYQQQGGELYR